jgi:hypothetical protein
LVHNGKEYYGISAPYLITGIRDGIEKDFQFSIFPNPNNGMFTFAINTAVSETKKSQITIYNIIGEVVYQSLISNQQSVIDLSSRPKGVYFIRINSGSSANTGKISTKKIIIQ